jgi:hypothetical protein
LWQTFVDDVATGPFLVNVPGLREWNVLTMTITGELENGVAPIGPANSACQFSFFMQPPSPSCGKMRGTWRFSGPNGVVYGESNLANGAGHLKLFWPDGVVASEGEVVGGFAEGTWKVYPSG